MTDQNGTPMVPVLIPAATSSSHHALKWAGLTVLALSIGGNAYLWHLWRQDQAVTQAMAQSSQELQAVQAQIQELQRLKTTVDQWTGALESLQKATGNGQIEIEALKAEIKRLQDSRVTYEAFVQKQLQTYQEQWVKQSQSQSQKRDEVNW
ncbi:MAG: hypothetical protein ACOYMW_03620 [Candidatus Competibacteraceae bacterium]